jgi:hypothetical protein
MHNDKFQDQNLVKNIRAKNINSHVYSNFNTLDPYDKFIYFESGRQSKNISNEQNFADEVNIIYPKMTVDLKNNS